MTTSLVSGRTDHRSAAKSPPRSRAPSLCARDNMRKTVLAIADDMTVAELARFLAREEITGAPVFDAAGALVGVVSTTDVVACDVIPPAERAASGESAGKPNASTTYHESLRVRDIMTPTVFTIPDDTPVSSIARTMIAGRIHRLLVTRDRQVVGIVTPLDLLKALA